MVCGTLASWGNSVPELDTSFETSYALDAISKCIVIIVQSLVFNIIGVLSTIELWVSSDS